MLEGVLGFRSGGGKAVGKCPSRYSVRMSSRNRGVPMSGATFLAGTSRSQTTDHHFQAGCWAVYGSAQQENTGEISASIYRSMTASHIMREPIEVRVNLTSRHLIGMR